MFTLKRRDTSLIPLEIDGILPSVVAKLSELEVAKLPIQHGNRREALGEFFDVGKNSVADIAFDGDTSNVHNIGLGMSEGTIWVSISAGRHAGAKMTGGRLTIFEEAGDWLGAEMSGGAIEVRGNAGNQAGAAYRGSRRGMRGGLIHIHGSAGDELGLLMRRGIILVDGPVGEFAGASMIAGSLFLNGGAGERLGAGMKRGTIVTRGDASVLPASFRFACRFRPTFLAVYASKLREWGHALSTSFGTSVMDCYRGDILNAGRGEVLISERES